MEWEIFTTLLDPIDLYRTTLSDPILYSLVNTKNDKLNYLL